MKATKTHYNGKPLKLAKCGNHTHHECTHHFKEITECRECELVHHRYYKLYITIDGKRYRKCAKCGKHKPLDQFAKRCDSGYEASWCKQCHSRYKYLK